MSTGNDRRRNGDRGARRPGRRAYLRLSRRRGAADLRRHLPAGQVKHMLVRHEQGAVHAAEGYARSTGKVGCVLVTSGPGATNAVTGLTDALMDSIPIVCHHRPGADAPDRQRRVPGMRHGRHHAALHQAQLSGEATSRICRAFCTRRSTSRRAAVRVRLSSTSRRTSSSPRAPIPARRTSRTRPTSRSSRATWTRSSRRST